MKKLASLLLTLIAVIISISCEIGLGSSVDTDPPSVSIESPEVDSIIRDSFAIRGSWSDDGSIKRLTVKLKNTRTEGAELEYAGELEENAEKRGSGSWSVLINPKDSEGGRAVADGSYQATVEIEDMMGRVTSQSTTFTVDNTAPVIVLTRPSTEIGSAGADTYGQTFSLEGQAADTNNVSLIEVEIYKDKECTQKQHTVKLYEVPNSINLDVAKFEKYNTENDYYKIYEETDTDKGAKTFYCKIVAYDGAQRYPADGSEQSEDDKKGNRIDSYYLYKDIATAIFTNYQLKITEVYSILSGTYTEKDTSRSAVSDSIKELLEKSRKTTGKFRLDPKNNPTYSVTGRSPLNLDGEDFKGSANNISNGQKVVIEVSPGLDGILLEKESLKVYAAECDARGNIIGEKIYPTLDEDQPAESGNSYRFTTPVTLADGFKIGHDYLWGVEGYDQSEAKNRVECAAKAYGFHMATSGKAPELTVTEPVKGNTYIGRGGSQKFSGKVKVESGSPEVTIYRRYTEEGEAREEAVKTFTYSEADGKESDSGIEYSFEYTIESFGNQSAQFDYRISAVQDSLESSAERSVIYDMDPPKISMLGSSPSTANILKYDEDDEGAEGEGGYLNGNVSFTFAVVDDFDAVEECTYSVVRKSDGEVLLPPVRMTKPTREEFTVATGEIADGTEIILVIAAKDRSGNSTRSGDEVNPVSYEYKVDQATDKPVLLPGDAGSITLTKLQTKEAYDSQSGVRKNLATIGSTLQFRLHDDDGLKSLKIRNSTSAVTSDAAAVEWTDYTVQNLSGTDTTFSYTLPTEGGLYKFEAELTDRNGLSNEYRFVINAVKPAAEISQITVEAKKGSDGEWEAKNISSSAVRNSFKIDESEGPYTLYRMINGGAFPNELPQATGGGIYVKGGLVKGDGSVLYDGSVQYRDEIAVTELEEGVNTIYYLIQDGNGRKGSVKFTQVIRDTTAPEASVDAFPKSYINTKSYTFRGSVNDDYFSSAEVRLYKDGNPTEQANTIISQGEWNWTVYELADAAYKIAVTAEDRAGNKTTVESSDLTVDTEKPHFDVKAVTGAGETAQETVLNDNETYYFNKDFTLKLGMTENHLKTITNGTESIKESLSGTSPSYTWEDTKTADGTYEYAFSAMDEGGNNSTFTVTVKRDTTAPVVAVEDALGSKIEQAAIKADLYSFTGTASDNEGGTGVAKIWYAFTDDTAEAPGSEANPTQGYTELPASNGMWSFVKSIDSGNQGAAALAAGRLSEGKWKLHVKAQDKAGNITAAESVRFDIDKADPAVTVSSDKSVYNTLDNEGKGVIAISGTAADTFGLDETAAVTVVIKKAGTEVKRRTLSNTDIVSGNWAKSFVYGSGYGENPSEEEDYLAPGTYEITATVKDSVGKENYAEAEFLIDYTAPVVTLLNADSEKNIGWLKGSGSTYISGSAADADSGITSLQVQIDNRGWESITVQNNWTYQLNFEGLGENTDTDTAHTIKVKATDRAGNTNGSDGDTYYFRYDKAAPSLTMTSDNESINGSRRLTISGQVYDGEGVSSNRPVKTLTLTAKKGADDYSFPEGAVSLSWTEGSENCGSYKYVIDGSKMDEGSYAFTLTAADYAGQTVQKSVNAIVDKTPPTFSKISVGSGSAVQDITSASDNSVNGSAERWYSTQTQSISVYASDALSGIETVEYRTEPASSTVTDDNAEWQPLTRKSETGPNDTTVIFYRGTAAFGDDAGRASRLHIRVTDKAGNSQKFYTNKPTEDAAGLDHVVFNIDTSKPALALSKVKIGSNAAKITSGTEYINSTNNLILYGTYSNSISGVGELTFFKGTESLEAASVAYHEGVIPDGAAIESLEYKGYGEVTEKKAITAWKAEFTNAALPSSSDDISALGVSVAGVSSGSIKLITLNRDNTKPLLNDISISADDANHTVYKKTVGTTETTDYYYLNNKAGTFKVTAQALDNIGSEESSASGVNNVRLEIPGIAEALNSASAQFTNIDLSGITGKGSVTAPLVIKLTVSDNAGNSEVYSRNIVFDTQAPSAQHEHDDKGKDLYFRVGAYDNTDIATTNTLWSDALDKDVGGKYGAGTYGNDTTIKLRGNFADEADGSGVKAIHYMVYQNINKPLDTFGVIPENATEEEIAQALSDALSVKNNGKSITLSAPSTRRVFYNVKETDGHDLNGTELAGSASSGYKKYYKEITTNFFESLSGFVPGNNYLVLAAEDNVGNIKVDVVTIGSGDAAVTYNNFSLNVDQTKPDVLQKDGFDFSHEYISNATAPQVIEFEILEADSGIEKNDFSQNTDFTVTLGSQNLTVEAAQSIPQTTDEKYDEQKEKNLIVVGTKDETTNRWPVSLQIGTAALGNAADGSKPSVTVTVKDKASNGSSPTQVGIMKMDKTAPVPSFSAPAADATVNKKITVSGKIEEANEVSSVTFTAAGNGKTVVYSYPAPQPETESAKALTFSNTTKEWSALIDTTEFYNETGSQTLTLSITAADSAGNVYDSDSSTDGNQALTRSVTIDQNTDRPVIKVSQIDSTGTGFVTVKTMFGTVDDDDKSDDSTVNKIWLWQKQEGKNSNAVPSTAPSYDSANGNWTEPAGWLEFGGNTNSSLDNNSWQLESDESDGESTWYWAVADRNNNVFWTRAESQLERPYIVFKGETALVDNTNGLSFRYDTVAPEISKIEFLRLATDVYKEGNTRYEAEEIEGYITEMNEAGSSLSWISDDNYVFGKDKALMYIKAEVKEETGMAETNPLTVEGFGNQITITSSMYNVSGPSADKKYTYIIGPVDLSSYNLLPTTEGYPRLMLTFRAQDAAGKSFAKTKPIIIDNIANITMEKITPKPQNETSGEFTFRAQVTDSESSVADVKYYIPQYGQTIPSSAEADSYTWNEVNDLTSIQITIEFTDFNRILGYQTTSGGAATVAEGFQSYDIGGTGTNAQGVYNIPVWFKVTDEVGNVGYVKQYVIKDANGNITSTDNDIIIKYNPDTDRPKVYITSPEIPENASYVEKGGRIKISGSAEDNEGIAGVYLQFAVGEDGAFAPTLVIDENGNPSAGGASTGEEIPGTTLRGTKANNTKNWNYTLDVKNVPQDQSPIIKIRAIAVDIDETNGQLSSAWSDVLTIKVDNSIPSFGSMKLVNDVTGAEIEYQPGMYIKGNWTLHGSVSTTSDWLKSLSIERYTWSKAAADGTGSWATEGTHTGAYSGAEVTPADSQTFSFTIPVRVSDSQTEWTVEIEATDGSENASSNTENPQINIDNTAPEFADYVLTTDSNATVKDGRQIKLYQDTYGPAGRMLDTTSNFLQNSNGAKFTLAGKVIEPASGFEKAVFYIERAGTDEVKRLYNPMEGHGTDNMANRTNISSTSPGDATHPVYINDDGLPVRNLTDKNTERTDSESFANDEIKTNMNIRQGGLVYIGGLYRTITAIDRDAGTVTIDPADEDRTHTTAQFVYGMVIDCTGEGENSDGSVRETDGDQLLESYSGSQSANYRWEATFDSSNIPDGPVNVHVVLFDQAGNISHGYAVTRASNNAPRITKVMIGTDLNGNGNYDFGSGEFSTFYAQKDDNNNPVTKTGMKNWTLDTSTVSEDNSLWKVKKGLAVIPEFVGGAGPFYYKFSKGAEAIKDAQQLVDAGETASEDFKLKDSGANNLIKQSGTDTNATWTYSTHNGVSNSGGSLTLTNKDLTGKDTLTNADDAAEIFYCFTFWDSTDDSTPGYDTGSTILNLKVEQDLTDGNAPEAKIKPFIWEGTGFSKTVTVTQNGVEQSPVNDVVTSLETGDILGTNITTDIDSESGDVTVTKTVITPKNSLYGASRANGHIELESDLPAVLKTSMGADPKVSGKITFHGTAKDDTRLSSIWFKFADFTAASGLTQTTTDGVTLYDASTTALTGYTQAAWYNSETAEWVNASATMADSHWEFTASDSSFDQNGHSVDWYLSIDTAYITNTVGLNKALSVISVDAAGSPSVTSSVQTTTTTNTPYYSMDVVPYVSSLTTSLSGFQSGNPSVYDRTALGHYPVYMTHAQGNGAYTYETIEVNGFNLYGTKMKFENVAVPTAIGAYKDQAADGTYPDAASLAETKHYRVTLPADLKSGEIAVWSDDSGTIKSLNNLNNNDAKGKVTDSTTTEAGGYTGCYNRQPNGINNNRLTDDLVIDVWDLNSKAATPKGDSNFISDIVMKINMSKWKKKKK